MSSRTRYWIKAVVLAATGFANATASAQESSLSLETVLSAVREVKSGHASLSTFPCEIELTEVFGEAYGSFLVR